jgi:3-oxoacyl-[acyl-carrier-protein] synthase III
MVEAITEYVSEHGVQAASQRFHCSPKAVYNVLHRYGYTCRARDMFSLAEICNHLRVKYSKALAWIEQGLLLAHREMTRTGRPRYLVDPKGSA